MYESTTSASSCFAVRSLWVPRSVVLTGLLALTAVGAEDPMARTRALLESGSETVRVVGFGDSITGVYYHTGGHRAWPEMLAVGLQRAYPKARVAMTNAGRSGNTTGAGLKRIEKDVLSGEPHLVVVMFGMNDLALDGTGKTVEQLAAARRNFQQNLVTIVDLCRGRGAEVVLCTPNSIYPDGGPRRPMERIAEYAEAVREVAEEKGVPLADGYAAYEALRQADPRAWMLCMSETIHPSMAGHKLFAETMVQTISGRSVALKDVGPVQPCLPHVAKLIAGGKPITLIAPESYAQPTAEALRSAGATDVRITTWPTQGQPLKAMETWAKTTVRAAKPDMVLVAVPDSALPANSDDESLIRAYSWVVNWSLAFGTSQWDVVGVVPSVAAAGSRTESAARTDELACQIILGHDVPVIVRPAGSDDSAAILIKAWVRKQLGRPE